MPSLWVGSPIKAWIRVTAFFLGKFASCQEHCFSGPLLALSPRGGEGRWAAITHQCAGGAQDSKWHWGNPSLAEVATMDRCLLPGLLLGSRQSDLCTPQRRGCCTGGRCQTSAEHPRICPATPASLGMDKSATVGSRRALQVLEDHRSVEGSLASLTTSVQYSCHPPATITVP